MALAPSPKPVHSPFPSARTSLSPLQQLNRTVNFRGVRLTPRQIDLINNYILLGCTNGAEAARRAGVSPPQASRYASSLLSRPAVKEIISYYVNDSLDALLGKSRSADAILLETAKVAFVDPRDFVTPSGDPIPLHALSDKAAGAVSSIESEINKDGVEVTKYKMHDKMRALTLLGTHAGVFVEKKELKITLGLAEDMQRIRSERIAREVTDAIVTESQASPPSPPSVTTQADD